MCSEFRSENSLKFAHILTALFGNTVSSWLTHLIVELVANEPNYYLPGFIAIHTTRTGFFVFFSHNIDIALIIFSLSRPDASDVNFKLGKKVFF